jgi:serine protease Do
MNLLKRIGDKSAYLTLGLGLALGLGLTTVVFRSGIVPKASADPTVVKPIAGISAENMAALRALDSSFASLASYIEPSVVHINAESDGQRDMMGRRMGVVGGEGSGVIFRPDGWIVTNDHVVAGFDKVTVVLQDGHEYPGKVIRSDDRSIDVAVVKIAANNLPAAQFGDSRSVRPGQFAIAVGSPFGLDNSVTIGHISALGRQREVGDEHLGDIRVYSNFIQTDAPLNQGNSGGPLVNIEGQVIGINTAIYSGTGGNVGIGFAIPSNFARYVAETLIDNGKVVRGYLGVRPEDLKGYQLKDLNLTGGAIVAEAPNDGPAAAAGIRKDDVIIRIGETTVNGQDDLRTAMLRHAPGSKVPVEFVRDGVTKTVQVKVGKVPEAVVAQSQPNQGPQTENPFGAFPNFPNFQGFGNPDDGFGIPSPQGDDGSPGVRVGQAKLGVTVQNLTPALRNRYHIPSDVQGAVVTSVVPKSVAARNSFQVGDVIQRIGNKTVTSAADVSYAMAGVRWGQTKQMKVTHFEKNLTASRDMPVQFR